MIAYWATHKHPLQGTVMSEETRAKIAEAGRARIPKGLCRRCDLPLYSDEAMEYRIGARVVQRHDFLEGVRAVIVEKDHAPRWNPPTPEGVSETMLDAIFAGLPSTEEWTPLT